MSTVELNKKQTNKKFIGKFTRQNKSKELEKMEAIQCQESTSQAMTTKLEQNRVLKRNIGDLAIDSKINQEDIRSPIRKGVKVGHETLLVRELEQWKELMKEKGICQSIALRNIAESTENIGNFDAILKADQKSFIDEVIDIPAMLQESYEFRYKFDFFLRLNKVAISIMTDKSMEAFDKTKQLQINYRTSNRMHCERFQPIET